MAGELSQRQNFKRNLEEETKTKIFQEWKRELPNYRMW